MSDFPYLPVCWYRHLVRDGAGSAPYYVCGCSGGIPIGTMGEEALGLADTPTSRRERVMTRIREIAGILFPAGGMTRRFRKGSGPS